MVVKYGCKRSVSSLASYRVQITRDSKLHKWKKPFPAGGEWPGNAAGPQGRLHVHLK